MAVKFFGQFLVEKGIVSREDLLAAIALQEQKNLKFGEMAVAMGYVTAADIERAHNAQFSQDMKLGDILLAIGLLTAEQLQEVVARQKATHLYIGEALVQAGALAGGDLQKHLRDFNEDQAAYISSGVELPAGVANPEIWETAVDLTYKMVTRVVGLAFRTEKSRIVTKLDSNFMMAAIDFTGDMEARYILSVSEGVQKAVARAILHEESVENEPAEVLDDCVMEFVNVVCGNIAAKISQMGREMNISTPMTIHPEAEGVPVLAGHTALSFPIYVGEGEKMELLLVIPG